MKQKHRDECAKKTVSANDSDSDMGLESLIQPWTLIIISKVILKKTPDWILGVHGSNQYFSVKKKNR